MFREFISIFFIGTGLVLPGLKLFQAPERSLNAKLDSSFRSTRGQLGAEKVTHNDLISEDFPFVANRAVLMLCDVDDSAALEIGHNPEFPISLDGTFQISQLAPDAEKYKIVLINDNDQKPGKRFVIGSAKLENAFRFDDPRVEKSPEPKSNSSWLIHQGPGPKLASSP